MNSGLLLKDRRSHALAEHKVDDTQGTPCTDMVSLRGFPVTRPPDDRCACRRILVVTSEVPFVTTVAAVVAPPRRGKEVRSTRVRILQ